MSRAKSLIAVLEAPPADSFATTINTTRILQQGIRSGDILPNVLMFDQETSNEWQGAFDLTQADHRDTAQRFMLTLLEWAEIRYEWQPWVSVAEQLLEYTLPPQVEALLCYGVGRYYQETGLQDDSLLYHQHGLDVAAAESLEVALNLRGLSIVLQRRSKEDMPRAVDSVERSLNLLEGMSQPYYYALTLADRGSVLYRQQEYEGALVWYDRCMAVFEQVGDRSLTDNIWYSIGWSYLEMGRFDDAMQAFNTGKEIAQLLDRKHDDALLDYGISHAAYRTRDMQRAYNTLLTAQSHFRDEQNYMMLGMIGVLLGPTLTHLNRTDQAEAELLEARDHLMKTGSAQQMSRVHEKLGRLYLNQDRLDEALHMFDIALEHAEDTPGRGVYLEAAVGKLESLVKRHGVLYPSVIRLGLSLGVELLRTKNVRLLQRIRRMLGV